MNYTRNYTRRVESTVNESGGSWMVALPFSMVGAGIARSYQSVGVFPGIHFFRVAACQLPGLFNPHGIHDPATPNR